MGNAQQNNDASPSIDIIIVNYNSANDTLTSVKSLTPWTHGQIILVDNSEDDAEVERLSQALSSAPSVQLLVAPKNLGFGRGCNLAFAQSTADFVFLLNPDAIIDEVNILCLVNALQQNQSYGAVSPLIYWDRSRRFLLPTAIPPTPSMSLTLALASRFKRVGKWWSQHYLKKMRAAMASKILFKTPFLIGSVMLLRRSAVIAAGGLFDEDYFMFFEDSDLSLRLRRASFQLGVVPTAEAVHEYRQKDFKVPLMDESRHLYFKKNYPRFYRVTHGLAGLARIGSTITWEDWGNALASEVHSHDELQRLLGNHLRLVALSPSAMMIPALFRPLDTGAVALSEEDWNQLEPGRYMLCCVQDTDTQQQCWICFIKTAK